MMPQSALGSGEAVRPSHKHETEHDDVGAEAKRPHFSGYDDVPHGNVVPQTPASVAEDVLDDTPFEQMAGPAKSVKHDGPGSINLLEVVSRTSSTWTSSPTCHCKRMMLTCWFNISWICNMSAMSLRRTCKPSSRNSVFLTHLKSQSSVQRSLKGSTAGRRS